MKPEFFCSSEIFIVKMLMKHGICLQGLLRTRLSLKRLVVFMDILFSILVYFILDLIMLLFGVTCVILLTIILHHVLIMHAMLNLTLHHPGTKLMLSWPYLIHPYL